VLILERNIFFFTDWVPYFVSLQEDFILLFTSREKWEQGITPDKVDRLCCGIHLFQVRKAYP
jgi:hypothetical protein